MPIPFYSCFRSSLCFTSWLSETLFQIVLFQELRIPTLVFGGVVISFFATSSDIPWEPWELSWVHQSNLCSLYWVCSFEPKFVGITSTVNDIQHQHHFPSALTTTITADIEALAAPSDNVKHGFSYMQSPLPSSRYHGCLMMV